MQSTPLSHRLVLPILLAFALPVAAQAADPQPAYSGLSAKRVKPPAPGTQKRITVQIAPRANPAVPPLPEKPVPTAAAVAPKAPGTAADTPKGAHYAWFWGLAPAADEGRGAHRLETALAALGKGPGGRSVTAPRLQVLQDMAEAHGTALLRHSVGTRVSPALALAVMAVESAGKTRAVSHAGAQGLMQLVPATAKRFGVTDSFDADQNIRGAIAYLDFLLGMFDDDPLLALAGYNAGENAVTRAGGVPDYAETRDYVPKVLAAYAVATGLCRTPPVLHTDGCVFNVSN